MSVVVVLDILVKKRKKIKALYRIRIRQANPSIFMRMLSNMSNQSLEISSDKIDP